MKLFKYGLPFAALALLASCANDKLGEPTPDQNGTDPVLGDGTYINLNFAVSSTGTRASFESGGLESEYAVKDATLYLFDETDKKCVAIISLDRYFGLENGTKVDIEKKKTISAIDISDAANSSGQFGTYYALVILNKNGLTDKDNNTNLPVIGTDFATWLKTPIDYNGVAANKIMRDGDFFTMTNALGWTGVITGTPSWLAKVDNTNYYNKNNKTTQTDVRIYLNRGVSKVTLAEVGNEDYQSKIEIGKWCPVKEGSDDYILMTDWALEVTNQKSFPVQNYETTTAGASQWYTNGSAGISLGDNWAAGGNFPLARFTKLNSTQGGAFSDFHRLHWAVDPNYENITSTQESDYPFNHATDANFAWTTIHDNPQYCLENTFNVAGMRHNQTTRVIFKGYYLPNQEGTPANTVTKGQDFLSYEDKYFVVEFPMEVNTEAQNFRAADMTVPLNEAFKDFETSQAAIEKYKEHEAWADDLSSYPTNTEEGKAAILEYAKQAYDEQKAKIHEYLDRSPGSTERVSYHKDGVVYYTVLVRHFDATELGLNNGGPDDPEWTAKVIYDKSKDQLNLTGEEYPTTLDQYLLGRYGMVRNNWYELCLESVEAVGYPYLPAPDNKTDDDKSRVMIDVQIHVLAWAKRSQDVDLQ